MDKAAKQINFYRQLVSTSIQCSPWRWRQDSGVHRVLGPVRVLLGIYISRIMYHIMKGTKGIHKNSDYQWNLKICCDKMLHYFYWEMMLFSPKWSAVMKESLCLLLFISYINAALPPQKIYTFFKSEPLNLLFLVREHLCFSLSELP